MNVIHPWPTWPILFHTYPIFWLEAPILSGLNLCWAPDSIWDLLVCLHVVPSSCKAGRVTNVHTVDLEKHLTTSVQMQWPSHRMLAHVLGRIKSFPCYLVIGISLSRKPKQHGDGRCTMTMIHPALIYTHINRNLKDPLSVKLPRLIALAAMHRLVAPCTHCHGSVKSAKSWHRTSYFGLVRKSFMKGPEWLQTNRTALQNPSFTHLGFLKIKIIKPLKKLLWLF